MKNRTAKTINKPWRARRWIPTALLVVAQALSAFAVPPQGIKDTAGNPLAGLPYTGGETYIYNPNQAPTDLALGNSSVNQSDGPNGVVGVLSTTDADTGDSHTYSLVAGTGDTNNALFNTSGSSLRVNNAAIAARAYSLRLQTDDGHGGTFAKAFTVTVVDDFAPIAYADSYSITEDAALTVTAPGVLANDTDRANTNLTALLASGPAHGSLTLNADGSFTYQPETNYNGSDNFTYRANDGLLNSAAATVSLTVSAVNDTPVTFDQFVITPEDTSTNLVLGASDIDGDALEYVILSVPTNGTLDTLSLTNGLVTYLPATNFNGADAFTFTISDGFLTVTGAVSLTVTPVNDSPIAAAQNVIVAEDYAQEIALTASDVDGDELTYSIVAAPTNGTLSGVLPNITYLPSTNFHGSDNFTFLVNDGSTNSEAATVSLTIYPLNDAPVALADGFITAEDTALTVVAPGVLANDSDVDEDTLFAELVTQSEHGLLTLNEDGSFTYLPNTNFHGTDSFTYRANDFGGKFLKGVNVANGHSIQYSPTTVTLTVTPVNDAPIALNESYTTGEDYLLTVVAAGVLANDSDIDGDVLTAVLVSGPSHGTLTLDANGAFTYLPSTNYHGSDSFIYQANDGALNSGVATVSLTIYPINDIPVAANDSYTTDEDTTLTITAPGVLVNDLDVDGDALIVTVVTAPTNGSLTLNTNGSFTYLPNTNFHGSDSFTYRASDLGGQQNVLAGDPKGGSKFKIQNGTDVATVLITVNSVNDVPVAQNDSYTTDEDTLLTIAVAGVLANDSDIDGDVLSAVLVSGPSHGSLTLNANGSFTYLPSTNWFGSDSFTYQANDGTINSATATVSLTVNPVDDLPVLVINGGLNLLPTSTRTIGAAQFQVTDVETSSDGLVFTVTTAPAHGVLRLNGTNLAVNGTFTQSDINSNRVVYSNIGDASSTDSFTFVMNATDGGSVTATSFAIALNRIEREGENVAGSFSISADGRYVAFQSTASNLVANDTNGVADIFVLDRYTGVTTLISASSAGEEGNSASDWPRISADGRFVTFQSSASNLVGDDSNNRIDVFVHDRVTAQTVRVSVSSGGAQANIDSLNPAISADGRYVAFHSFANNLVAGDVANQTDVFVHDLQTHVTERVSVTSGGAEGDNASTFASLSADGRFVAFQSNARNLVTGDTNNSADVFVHDRQTHTTTRVSVSSDGTQGNNSSVFPSISDDGRYVTFQANASNLVPNDSNNTTDVMLHDRQTAQTIRVSVSSVGVAGNGASSDPKISNDGRYIVFTSLATSLVAGDANAVSDIFVYDRLSARTTRVNLAPSGTQADAASTKPVISAGGRLIAFLSRASNLLPSANSLDQIYMVFFNDQPTITSLANVTIDEDGTTGPLAFTVNDVKTDLTSLIVSATSSDSVLVPAQGIVLGGSAGARTVTITPAANAFGTATITVVVSDGSLASSNSFVVTVNAVNDAPFSVADSATTAEDTLLTVSALGVLANDSDVENSALTAVLVSGTAHGALTLNADGSFSYLPATNWHGTDAFTYVANDGGSNSAPATVLIEVTSVNDISIASGQEFSATEDTAKDITLAASDVDGDTLSFRVVNPPTHGALSGTAPNLVYLPGTNFHGADSFTFVANDGTVDSAPATIFIYVTAVNDISIANAQSVTLNEDNTAAITLTGSDVDGDALNFSVIGGPSHGALSGELPNLVYTPATNFHGSDSFTFVVNDSAPVSVSLTVAAVNDISIANAQSVTLNEDGTASVTLTASDVDGDTLNFSIVTSPAHGTLSGEIPNLVYAPSTNFHGSDGFTFTANDGTVDSLAATVSLTINAVNDSPVTFDQFVITAEDTATNLVLGASDVDGDALEYVILSAPTNGTLDTLSLTNGLVTYLPATNFNGGDAFSFTISDGFLTVTGTVTLAVTPVNDISIAAAQNVSVNEDTALPITLTSSDVDGDTLSYSVVTTPVHGTLSGELPNLVYLPATNFHGSDSFTFIVNDGLTNSELATVSITVNSVNDISIADAQSITLDEDNTLAIMLTGSDVDGDALSFNVIGGPSHGTLSGELPNLVYTPATNFHGNDSFVFVVNDSVPVSVSLTVTAVNDISIANAQSVTLNEDGTASVTLTASDVDGDTLNFSIVTSPAHGTLSGEIPNLVYTPNTNFHGSDSFTFVVNDGTVDSLAATVSLTVNAVNDSPVTFDQFVITPEDTSTNLVLGASDVDGDALEYVILSAPTNGTLDTLSLTNGLVAYLPATNFNGGDAFSFTISDGFLTVTGTVTLAVTPVNDMPIADAQSLSVNEDMALEITLTSSDVDGDTLSYSIVSLPGHGTLSGELPNLVYLPATNFHGSDSFTFLVNDGSTNSELATVSITVNAVNDISIANAQSITLNEDTFANITLTGSDVDGDTLSFSVLVQPEHGVLSGELPNLVYSPATNFHGSDSFTFVVNDSVPVSVSLTITPVNDRPIADSQGVTLNEDIATAITLTAGDVDGDTLSFSIVTPPAHGTLSGTLPNVIYTPVTNYFGGDSFVFVVNDGTVDSAPAIVSLAINPVNDAPLAHNDSYATDEEQTLNVSAPGVLANDSDVEGSALTAHLVSSTTHGSLTLNANGSFRYVPRLDFFGTDTFVYRANDGVLDSASTTVTLTVNNIPDAPIATNNVFTLNEDTTLVVNAPGVLTNDFDADFDTLNAVLVVGPSHGTLELNEDGGFTYTPDTNWFGTDGFSYLANDGLSDSEPVDVLLTVNPVNDAPFTLSKNYATLEDTLLTVPAVIGVLVGASDVEEESLTAVLATSAAHGTVTLNANGSFTYAPATNFNGVDGFSYKAFDGTDLGAETAVTIMVSAVNDAPVVASAISAQNGVYGTPFSFTFDAATFADVDGDTLSYSASGLPAGISFNAATRTFSGTPTQAGNYTVQVVANDGQAPALTVSTSFAFTVAKAPLTITADHKTRNYGAMNPELTISYAGFVLGNEASVLDSAPVIATDVTVANGVGVYPITLSGGSDDNYEISLVNGTLTIGKATVIATALHQSRNYGATNPELAIAYSGFVNEEGTNVLNVLPVASTEATPSSAVGTYPITLTGGSDDNYEIALVNNTLTIGKATVIATADNKTGVYGAANPELTISYSGFVNDEDTNVLNVLPVATTEAVTNSTVGEYAIVLAGGSDDNYDITLVNGTLTIGKATLLVAADNQSRIYGTTNPVLTATFTGFVNAEDTNVLSGSPELTTLAETNSPIGVYDIVAGLGTLSATNYDFAFTNGTLTIAKATLTVAANNQTRTYGAANPELTYQVSGFVDGEDTNVLSGAAVLNTSASEVSPVSSYAIVIEAGTLTAMNYAFSFTNGTLTVTKAALLATADNQVRIYGAANPTLTISYSGFVNDEDSSVLNVLPVATTDAVTNSGVGEYAIVLAGGSDDNYEITLANGTLVISRATIIAIADNQTRVYGVANEELTIGYSGFANGEDEGMIDSLPVASSTATASSSVGTRPITLSGGSDDNYDFLLTNGVLTITKASMTIRANNATRSYGLANPAFTGTISGMVDVDGITANYDTAAVANSPVSTYSIVPSVVDSLGRAGNYNIALVNGTLTVTSDDAPVIALTSTPGYYVIGNDAILVDTNAFVSDGGSFDFSGGTLTVTIVSNSATWDILTLETNGVITVNGSTVRFGGLTFGTFSGGDGTNAMVFSLNANATPAIVQSLVRHLTFETDDTNSASRVLQFALTDGDGGTSVPAFRTLTLDRPPIAPDDYVLTTQNLTVSIPFSLVLTNDYDMDADHITITGLSVVSAYGGRVTMNGSQFTYRPPTNFLGNDLFAYLIEDGRGGEGIGIVNIQVLEKKILTIDLSQMRASGPAAGAKIMMAGTPGQIYEVQVSEDLVHWSVLTTVTAGPNGIIEALDADAMNRVKMFYRVVLH